MPSNRWHAKLLLVGLLAFALAHGATPLTNQRVRQLGEMLHCMCGCNSSVTSCNMMNCHFADPVRHRLLTLVEQGATDKDIFAEMETTYGKAILRQPPAEGFYLMSWVMPFAGLAVGLAVIVFLIRFYFGRRPAVAGAAPGAETSPELAQYKERIEKDLANLDS
jgi:cytochrome c-type biogenesis protein CcmH/NrfF